MVGEAGKHRRRKQTGHDLWRSLNLHISCVVLIYYAWLHNRNISIGWLHEQPFLLLTHERFTRKYTNRTIHTKPHLGLTWHIFHLSFSQLVSGRNSTNPASWLVRWAGGIFSSRPIRRRRQFINASVPPGGGGTNTHCISEFDCVQEGRYS